jgi:MoxR-like ATPase
MIRTAAGVLAPAAPKSPEETGLDTWVLSDLVMRCAATVPHLTTDWAARQLRLPHALLERIFWQLKEDQLVEILGQVDELNYRYASTNRGREHAKRLLEICGYVGPAPVSLAAYTAMLDWQTAQRGPADFDHVRRTVAETLVLPEQAVEVAALATSSARSLFVFGPPGNGKTSLGRTLAATIGGEIWIPYCIDIDGSVIRIFDRHIHQAVEGADETGGSAFGRADVDGRWVRVRAPFVVAGGEMTMAELDLAYSPGHRLYEAPPHMKANGGTFMIDDFGRQRIEPSELLNRWIIPLEHRVDYLTLRTGQKIQIPFRLMLVVATNLAVNEVSDPAFLRRMGYRLLVDKPSVDSYRDIFHRYARSVGLDVPESVLAQVLRRYEAEGRELRASEPRDLIERVRDWCRARRRPFKLDDEALAIAWKAYFGLSD